MRIHPGLCLFTAAAIAVTMPAQAADDSKQTVQELHHELQHLQQRLNQVQTKLSEVSKTAEQAEDAAERVATRPVQHTSSPNAFNPAIGVVLVGRYATLGTGGEDYAIPGFILGDEAGPGEPGFSLVESELNFSANIDDRFYGDITFSLHSHEGETEVEIEQAYVQTLALPAGLRVTAGRFFSAIGYLNSRHTHTDDFVNRPLPYQAFLGNQYKDDGVRLSWLAPTSIFLQLSFEAFDGGNLPAQSEAAESPGAWAVHGHAGGDIGIGIGSSWRAGLSYLNAEVDAPATTGTGTPLFSGDRALWIADFVYKWAPGGNARYRSFQLQGEYFLRNADGQYGGKGYDAHQAGWYLQGTYQFEAQWRFGYRYSRLDADNSGIVVAGSTLDNRGLTPERHSLVLEWLNSEFCKIQLQYSHDASTAVSDNQFYLQYTMSLGAHGAHQF